MNRRLLAPFGIIVLIAASLLVLGGTGDATFKPSWGPAGTTPVAFSTLATGANPNITTSLNIDQPSNNFSESVTFGDNAVATATTGTTVSDVPIGAYVGSLSSVAQLGLANSGCWNSVPVTFNFVAATVSQTTVISPLTNDPANVLANFAQDDGDLDNNGSVDVAAFAANGIADGADAYPSFLQTAFQGIVPRARYQGVAFVANSLIVILNLVEFNAGDLAALPNHYWMTSVWGKPAVAVLNDPVAAPSNSSITDFCNFTSVTALFGVSHDNLCTPVAGSPAGCTGIGLSYTLRLAVDGGTTGSTTPNEARPAGPFRATNPATAQTVRWRTYAMSLRNADGDGIDNANDTCPLVTDTVWDPYAIFSAGDADDDGIPDTCDTVPGSVDFDQDSDTWLNRGDNCPQVANGAFTTTPNLNQYDSDIAPGVTVPDGGPRTDSIGPACDPNPTVPNGRYHATVIAQKICIGGATSDCSTGTDTDGDGIFNAFDNCIAGANPLISGYSQSQRDLNADNTSDIADLSLVSGAFGKVGGTPGAPAGYEGRLDLNYDSVIDISDISLISGTFGKAC